MLTFDEIEECLPEGGFPLPNGSTAVSAQWLHDFAHAVAAVEREACAKVVEAEHVGENVDDECRYSKSDGGYNMGLRHAASSIRERSNAKLTGVPPTDATKGD